MDVYYILAVLFNRMAMADSNNSSPPASRRREKPQLSCTLCRRRKYRSLSNARMRGCPSH